MNPFDLIAVFNNPTPEKVISLLKSIVTDEMIQGITQAIDTGHKNFCSALPQGHTVSVEFLRDDDGISRIRVWGNHMLNTPEHTRQLISEYVFTEYNQALLFGQIGYILSLSANAKVEQLEAKHEQLNQQLDEEVQRGENLKLIAAGVSAVENIIEATPKTETDVQRNNAE